MNHTHSGSGRLRDTFYELLPVTFVVDLLKQYKFTRTTAASPQQANAGTVSETAFLTNANNISAEDIQYNIYSKHLRPMRDCSKCWKCERMEIGGVREMDGSGTRLGWRALTNSILCCCSCFHGALSPSFSASPPPFPHSLYSLSHTHTHTECIWKRIQLCESICNQPALPERERERDGEGERERAPHSLRQTFHLSSRLPWITPISSVFSPPPTSLQSFLNLF